MKEKAISQTAKNLGGIISKNSPTILTGIAVGGFVTTVIFAVRATPKAMEILDDYKDERCSDCMSKRGDRECEHCVDYSLTKKEILKLTWKAYIPTVTMGVVTIACVIGSNSINQRRNAALATVYGVTEAAFREYKEKVVETIGKSKELKLRDEISAEHVRRNPPGEENVILTGKGNVLCRDSFSGRYFRSDIEKIRRSINDINKQFLSEMWVSINEVYYELGLSETTLGNLLGWDLDQGLLDISFSSQVTENGEPCLVLNYEIVPKFYN